MQFTEIITETFRVVPCYTCGVRFGISQQLYKRAVTDATGGVYCPACGNSTCWRESESSKRIKELEKKLTWEANQAADQKRARDAAEAALKATKGIVTRMKRRTSSGTCPCCKRTFRQLAAHMKTKHPGFAK